MKSTQNTTSGRIAKACIIPLFLYLASTGCTDPQELIVPAHLTRVPGIRDLQASVGISPGGKRRVLLTWTYDSSITNIRAWDVQRSVNDSSESALSFHEIIRKPAGGGYPFYSDTSSRLQNFSTDSIDVYYRVIPNGDTDNFVGEPSKRLHVIVRRVL